MPVVLQGCVCHSPLAPGVAHLILTVVHSRRPQAGLVAHGEGYRREPGVGCGLGDCSKMESKAQSLSDSEAPAVFCSPRDNSSAMGTTRKPWQEVARWQEGHLY